MDDDQPTLLGIGAISERSGIPISTLRTWERRYGWPDPARTEGRQRVYDAAVVPRLRQVAAALADGHRAAQVLRMSPEALAALVETGDGLDAWLDAVRSLDGATLQQCFRRDAARTGIVSFLEERAAPFMVRVGELWEEQVILPVHEHFATEQLHDFLVSTWRPLAVDSAAPTALCATLPGERHVIGLHMAATVLALRGWRILMVGADTPIGDLATGATQSAAQAVFVSVSPCAPPPDTTKLLKRLRRELPRDVRLVAGGSGAPTGIAGVEVMRRVDGIPAAPSEGGEERG